MYCSTQFLCRYMGRSEHSCWPRGQNSWIASYIYMFRFKVTPVLPHSVLQYEKIVEPGIHIKCFPGDLPQCI